MAVGTVTCLLNLDLLRVVPVVVVGKGAAAVQAAGDFNGTRRPIIFADLMAGVNPADTLVTLSGIAGHEDRQYGIVDTQGRKITFTGSTTLQWAGGVVGQQGDMVYAIQGNILAGSCVVPAIEQAILNTPGDIPEKLMAGMQAARQTGGDGRCSCGNTDPTGCGCPPPSFTRAGIIGGMVVARVGDTDDPVCDSGGCVDGNYFMRLNALTEDLLPPVQVLQAKFDEWRAGLVGDPDGIQSVATLPVSRLQADGQATINLDIELRDWSGGPVTEEVLTVTVAHSPDSDGLGTIGSVTNNGDGTYTVPITAPDVPGTDRFRIQAFQIDKSVVLMPEPQLEYFEPTPALTGWGLACLAGAILAVGIVLSWRLRRVAPTVG